MNSQPPHSLHKQMAIDLFNHTWSLMDKPERTQQEIDEMIHAAHASRYHWGIAGEALQRQRGEWQISRMYALLERSEPCLYHARRCLEITLENAIDDFDLAFAYEAMARACSLLEMDADTRQYRGLALTAAETIGDEEDRRYFLEELESI